MRIAPLDRSYPAPDAPRYTPRGLFRIPQCTACAACCTSRSARHAPVTGEDWSRLGEDAERLTVWIENRAFMRMDQDRCTALVVEGDRTRCAIYDRRPGICRELERGSPACEAEIVREGPARDASRSAPE